MTRRSKGFSVVTALVALGCGSRPTEAAFATAAELPSAPRRPDGVVVEPAPELPVAAQTRQADAPLVALRPPLPDKAARRAVSAFFRAVIGENLEALADLATPDANVPNKTGGSQPLVDSWRARMRQLRYQALSGELLYQDADIELYGYADLEILAVGRPQRPAAMAISDILLRVPMRVVQGSSDRLFGSELVFVLRPDRGRFRIRQILEDFQLP
jgi:hypothetical protein